MPKNQPFYCFYYIIFLLLTSCATNGSDYDLICNTDLTEETETLFFEGDYGDIETFFEFEIYKHKYNVEIYFDKEIIKSYKDAVRTLSFYENETPPSTETFYNVFLNDDQDLYLLQGILETLRNRTIGTDYDIIEMIVGFVQTIPYDKYAADINYPYETLAFNKGDCDEKSILLCKLLNLEGYNACLFLYKKAKHMAVGLKVADAGYYRNGYVFIESTNTYPIGQRGKSADGKESKEEPEIIYPVNNNYEGYYEQFVDVEDCYREITIVHGKEYLQNNIKGKKLIENINQLESEKNTSILKINFSLRKLNTIKNTIDSISKIIDSKYNSVNYPLGLPPEIYGEYKLLANELEPKHKVYQDLLSEHNEYLEIQNNLIFKLNNFIKKLNKINNEEKSPSTRTTINLET